MIQIEIDYHTKKKRKKKRNEDETGNKNMEHNSLLLVCILGFFGLFVLFCDNKAFRPMSDKFEIINNCYSVFENKLYFRSDQEDRKNVQLEHHQ